MKIAAVLLVCLLGASACSKIAETGPAAGSGGRYLGIGIYTPGQLWSKLAAAAAPSDESAATIADDEQVIVVVDSRTGQVRQCGNVSGVCVAMDPWKGPPSPGLTAPVRLTQHRVVEEPVAAPLG